MVTLGERLQLSRRLASAIGAQRAGVLNAWLRSLRDIPRDFGGRLPVAHLEEFAPPTIDALIAYLARGDRKALRQLARTWAARQDGIGVGLGESLRAVLALGPAVAPILHRAGLASGQPLVEAFLAVLAEELGRFYSAALKGRVAEAARATQVAEERLLSLQTVAGAVAQEHDRERTLDLIAREALKLTGAEEARVYLPDADDTVLRPVVCIEPGGLCQRGDPVPVAGTALGQVYRSGYLLVTSGDEGGWGPGAGATIAAPLRTRDGAIGVLGVKKPAGESFARPEVELLGLFADQAAIALENARLFRETERRNEELTTLYRISAVAYRSLDLDRVLDGALDHTLEALGVPAGSIYLLDEACTQLELRAERGYLHDATAVAERATTAVGAGPVGQVAANGELLLVDLVDDATAVPRLTRGVAAPEPLRHYVGIPLRGKERTLGVLNVLSPHQGWGGNQVHNLALLTSIGDMIGVAIDNASLLTQREERLTQLAILNDILRAISAVLDLDSLYEAMYAGCSRLFDTTNFYIALVDPATGTLIPQRWYEGVRVPEEEGTPLTRGLSRFVVAERQPVRTDDYWAECRRRGVQGSTRLVGEAEGKLAWLGVPMIVGERVLGAMVVVSDRQCYTAEDATLLGAIASGCAVAIENARAYEGEQRRAEQLRALNEMSRQIVAIRKVEQLLPQVAGAVRDLFGYNHVGILLYAPERDELVLRAQADRDDAPSDLGLRIPVGDHIVGQAAATRAAVLVNDVAHEPRFLRTPALADSRAELAVPIRLGDRLLGVLAVESDHAGVFDAGDVAMLQTLADGVAVAIENARLFEAEGRRRQELRSILDVTTAATSSLLPDEVLQRVARGIADAVQVPACAVYLLDETGRWLLPAAGSGDASPALVAAFSSLPIDLTRDALLREVVESRRTVVCADLEHDPRPNQELVRALGLKSMLAVPLIAKEKVLGAVVVAAIGECYAFSPTQWRLVEGIAGSAALALENAQLYAHSRELATAEERNRLAREIHDTLAQGLTAVTLHLEVADAALDTPTALAEAREKVRTAMSLTRANLEEARRSVMDLRAAPLQDLLLPQALEQLVARAGREGRVEANYRGRGVDGRLPARLEAGFYRIAQELLSNIGKHADATQVDVTLEHSNGSLILTVADDGVGFDPAAARAPGLDGGFGLVGLRERVALLGGALQLDSAPDEGTRVRVTVPLSNAERGMRNAE